MRYWPFLTGRSHKSGHRIVAAPDFMTAEQARRLFDLLPAPRGSAEDDGRVVLRRVVRNLPIGPVTIFYRVFSATGQAYGIEHDGYLRDQYGRQILVTEGVLAPGVWEEIAQDDLKAVLDEAHAAVAPAFQKFWKSDEDFTDKYLSAREYQISSSMDRTLVGVFDVSAEPRSRLPQDSPSARHQGMWRRGMLATIVGMLVVVAVGAVGWQLWRAECGGLFSGYRLNDSAHGECIGVSDGSYLFNDPDAASHDTERRVIENINLLQQKIAEENRLVATSERYVKVVLLMPLTVSQSQPSAMSLEQIQRSLEGSYTALMRTNHTDTFGDPTTVKVQLWLANQGSQLESSPGFINQVVAVSEPEHPLVAVVGLGISRIQMVTAVNHLAERGIPMVSAVASADRLTHLSLLWSVSPADSHYVRSLRDFLDRQDRLTSGAIVLDESGDLYTRSLAQAYRTELAPYLKHPEQPFRGSTVASTLAPTVFDPVVRNLCNASVRTHDPLSMVFYAGREADFDEFAQALLARACPDQSLTVLIGAPDFSVVTDLRDSLTDARTELINPSLSAAPGSVDPPPGYTDFVTAYRKYVSGVEADLADGYVIGHHDALASAGQAIRLAALSRPTDIPESFDVVIGFGQLNLDFEVPGASGNLSFTANGGRATGQEIIVQRIE